MKKFKLFRISSFQKIIIGFALLILIGSLLLTLPIASRSGEKTPFVDALFTATSTACVTGLVVQDTATYWSGFGQAVIITLIQIGGLGVITMMLLAYMLTGKKIGLAQRSTMQDSISAHQVGGIVRYTRFILLVTAIIELTGAVLLSITFCSEFGVGRGIWYSFFHSISAFCNAGFDLMGIKGPFSSLTSYVSHPFVTLVVCLLIICGSLGFLTWQDIKAHKLSFRRYSFQSKVVILFTAILIILPAVYFFFIDFAGLDLKTRTLASLFQSVTLRTAGFNTVDINAMNDVSKLIMMGVMLVGGAPGSTAGGMKITTLAVILSASISVFKRRDSAQMFKRRIDDSTVRHALAILSLYLFLFLTSGFVISLVESLPLIDCLFETASAVATVGITVGITTSLSTLSRLILIMLMFFGRVGGLTLIYATLSGTRNTSSKLPVEKIIVG